MKKIKIIIPFVIVLVMSACATPFTAKERSLVKTFAVVNDLPSYPNVVKIGTTVFNNKSSAVHSALYKSAATQAIISNLKRKGYHFVNNTSSANLLVKLTGSYIDDMPGTNAYGFHQRSMFGIKTPPFSYVAIDVHMKGKKGGEFFKYTTALSKLPISNLPLNIKTLSTSQQNVLQNILLNDIRKSLSETLQASGL